MSLRSPRSSATQRSKPRVSPPLYAIDLGGSQEQTTVLVTMPIAGAILSQIPIGRLGDRVDRRRLPMILAAASAVGAMAFDPPALLPPS
jgi:MFS family permease